MTGAVDEIVPAAANDDLGPARMSPEPQAVASGWDPFEVWRTRVRDARRDAGESKAD
jgi:hypothetical protein